MGKFFTLARKRSTNAYSEVLLELNPAEKVWQLMKDKIAMKIYDTLDSLENKIDDLIYDLEGKLVKSITGYDF